MTRFEKLTLRTTDLDGAAAFYRDVLGAPVDVAGLPAAALARGAVPHWLGQLGVSSVAATAEAFVARGAVRLGPPQDALTIVRDAGGAIVGLTPAAGATAAPPLAWCLCHTREVERAAATHAALLGWRLHAPESIGAHGVFHPFATDEATAPSGAFVDVAGRAGTHPHWLFFFAAPAFDEAVEAARAGGAKPAGPPITLPDGARVAVFDDPWGAAFALRSG